MDHVAHIGKNKGPLRLLVNMLATEGATGRHT